VVEDEVMPKAVETPLKIQVGVDCYIDHGPSTCVAKESSEKPSSSLLKGNGVIVSVQ